MIEVLAVAGCMLLGGIIGAFTAVSIWPDRSDIPIGDAMTFAMGGAVGVFIGGVLGAVVAL